MTTKRKLEKQKARRKDFKRKKNILKQWEREERNRIMRGESRRGMPIHF